MASGGPEAAALEDDMVAGFSARRNRVRPEADDCFST